MTETGTAQPMHRHSSRPTFAPATDTYETDEAVVFFIDLPGVSGDALEVSLDGDRLILRGAVEPEAHDGYRPLLAEYCVGDFERAFVLTGPVDVNAIEAVLENGVLRLTLPKLRPAEPRHISVERA